MVQALGDRETRPLVMSDVGEEKPGTSPVSELDKSVEAVISGARNIKAPDRMRVRDAMNAADKPLAGRAGADHALGRAIGRSMMAGLRTIV